MPQPKGAKTGQDYARLNSTLNQSGTQKSNNALYQTVNGLIEGARTFQGFIQAQYNTLSGSLSTLYQTVADIITELNTVRNAARFGIYLQRLFGQAIPTNTETPLEFDNVIFDTGMMEDLANGNPQDIIIPAPGQYCITAQIEFGGAAGFVSIRTLINGNMINEVYFAGGGPQKFPYAILIPVLRNDVVNLAVWQDSGLDMDVKGDFQMFRVSYT